MSPTPDELHDDAWRLLHDLVRTPSPSGAEERAAAILCDWLEGHGVATNIDEAGSVHATVGRGDRTVLLAGHIDCADPYVPARLEGDTLWGRGSVDAKGPLAAFAAAAVAATERDDLQVHFVACTGEEADSRGARQLLADGVQADALIIGEPSGAHAVTLGYKGRLLVRVGYSGETSHAGHPDATPAERLVAGWQRLVDASDNPALDPATDLTTPRLVSLDAEPERGGWHAGALVDVRIPIDAYDAWADGRFTAMVRDAFHDGTVEVLDDTAPHGGDARTPVASAFRAAVRADGGQPRALVKTGTSDLNVLAPVLGVPALAYGPGDSALDHRPDEHIERAEFDAGIRVLRGALDALPDLLERNSAVQRA